MSASGQSKRILFIEDEDAVRALAAGLLREAGADVVEANGGWQALDALRRDGPAFDVVICDVMMPDIDCLVFARAARPHLRGAKLAVMPGYAERDLVSALSEVTDISFAAPAGRA